MFFLLRFMPGDPVATMLLGGGGAGNISPEVIAAERARLGLDQPIYLQFFKWFWGMLRGDFGYSFSSKKPVLGEFMARFPATLELGLCAIVLATILGIAAGMCDRVNVMYAGRIVETGSVDVIFERPRMLRSFASS